MTLERAASRVLGIKRYGVHVNGYTYLPPHAEEPQMPNHLASYLADLGDKSDLKLSKVPASLHMWIGVRSMNKPNWPGLLDLIVRAMDIFSAERARSAISKFSNDLGEYSNYVIYIFAYIYKILLLVSNK